MASKNDIVSTMEKLQQEIEQAASALPPSGWSKGIYENGWNARQILCHMASTSGMTGFIFNMAKAPAGSGGMGANFDIDSFNAQQVAARQAKSPNELLAEIGANFQRDIGAIRAAEDSTLTQHFKAPWGAEGALGDVIIESLNGHLGTHLADLRTAI